MGRDRCEMNMEHATPILLSASTASAMLGVSKATFWRRVRDGTFPGPVRIGGVTRWRRDKLIEAVERLSHDGEAAA